MSATSLVDNTVHIMVDEYQDTNTIQSDIVSWLAHAHQNIMVVGDDAQSIYSFRGANYRNMFEFQKKFKEPKIVKLEENYRSVQPILTFTNTLMNQANEKFTKCLFTNRKGSELPKVVDTRTEPEQAMFVCQYVKEQIAQGRHISDMAVLFRAGYHSFELETELARQGVRFMKYGGFKFLDSAHIKDFLAHLRVVINRDEAVSWDRILRLIKNVGQAKTNTIIQWMKTNNIPPGQIATWPGAGKRDSGIKSLSKLLAGLSSNNMKPQKAVEMVMEYYAPILQERFDNYPKRQKDLDQLMPMAGRYEKLRNFLDDLTLEPPSSASDLEPEKGMRPSRFPLSIRPKGLNGLLSSSSGPWKADSLLQWHKQSRRSGRRTEAHVCCCHPGQRSTDTVLSRTGIHAVMANGGGRL